MQMLTGAVVALACFVLGISADGAPTFGGNGGLPPWSKFKEGPGTKYNMDPAQMPWTLPKEFPMSGSAPAKPEQGENRPEQKGPSQEQFDVGLGKFNQAPDSNYRDPAQMPETLPQEFPSFGSALAKPMQGGHGLEHKDPSQKKFGVGLSEFMNGPRAKYNNDPARMPETLPNEFRSFGSALAKPMQGDHGPEHAHKVPSQEKFDVGLAKFEDGPRSKYSKDPAQMPETLRNGSPSFGSALAKPMQDGHGPEHKDPSHEKFGLGLAEFMDGPRAKYNNDPARMPETLPFKSFEFHV